MVGAGQVRLRGSDRHAGPRRAPGPVGSASRRPVCGRASLECPAPAHRRRPFSKRHPSPRPAAPADSRVRGTPGGAVKPGPVAQPVDDRGVSIGGNGSSFARSARSAGRARPGRAERHSEVARTPHRPPAPVRGPGAVRQVSHNWARNASARGCRAGPRSPPSVAGALVDERGPGCFVQDHSGTSLPNRTAAGGPILWQAIDIDGAVARPASSRGCGRSPGRSRGRSRP